MRLAALAASAALLVGAAQPASAAPAATPEISTSTVVVGPHGRGTYATFSVADAPASVRAMDLYLYGPGGSVLVDLQIRNRPGIWEGDFSFNRFDGVGKWKGVLILRDDAGKESRGGTVHFSVKRRTSLTVAGPKSRKGGVSGTLRKLTKSGSYQPYAGQKIRLYRWDGSWTYVTSGVTDAKGRYAFKAGAGKVQIRYAGTGVNASSVRTLN